jgi:dihydropteroate synthase
MGILNLTPDSFSDGGTLPDLDATLSRAEHMVAEGAGMLDIGGESTRPGAAPVSPQEELDRVVPFFEAVRGRLDVPLSVDTRKAEVARAAVAAGAQVVNDVSGLFHDADMASVVAEAGAGVVLMHMRGDPSTMASLAEYEHLLDEVADELERSVRRAVAEGIRREAIVVDPGIGFAKTAEQSLALLGDLKSIHGLGLPVLVGPSRKSFLGAVLDSPPSARLHGTVAACVSAYLEGARIFRVHDVEPVVQALRVIEAISAAAAWTAKRQDG